MTARRNIAFGLATQRRPKDEIARRVDEAISVVRLGAQADKLPGQLSGGQQQRVAIARAIVVGPPLVLMDEPLSNLDAKLRLEMRAEIRRIHSMLGCSTIYVTHDQEEALSLADRIVVMIDGQTPPDRHAGGALFPSGPRRRRRVHGLPQPASLAPPSGTQGARRWCSVAGGQVVGSPVEPDRGAGNRGDPAGGSASHGRRADRRHGGDRRVSRPRLLCRRARRRRRGAVLPLPSAGGSWR